MVSQWVTVILDKCSCLRPSHRLLPLFKLVEGKVGCGWHPWVFRSRSAVVFTLSPNRSGHVPEAHFDSDPGGILACDRYPAYKKLAGQWEGLQLAYCWALVRRN